eukprot:scaffold25270_cov104-Isochrysis_galbana.AAC.7
MLRRSAVRRSLHRINHSIERGGDRGVRPVALGINAAGDAHAFAHVVGAAACRGPQQTARTLDGDGLNIFGQVHPEKLREMRRQTGLHGSPPDFETRLLRQYGGTSE